MHRELSIKNSFENTIPIFNDERGFFTKYFSNSIKENYFKSYFAQNFSYSKAGTLRGLHFQISPYAQAKYVTCINGKILDFFIDLRRDSETFLKEEIILLDSEKMNSVFVPAGCAHGFYAIQDSKILYSISNKYVPDHAEVINPIQFYEQKILPLFSNIELNKLIISKQDSNAKTMDKYLKIFEGNLK